MITGGAALVRLAVWCSRLVQGLDHHLVKDSTGYVELARGFTDAYIRATSSSQELALLRPPGYPALLAVAMLPGRSVSGAMLVQLVAATALVPLTYALGRRLGAGDTAALIGAGVVAIEPMGVGFSVVPVSETASTLLLTTGMLLWISGLHPLRRRQLVLAGLVLGAATLVRPATLYIAPFAFTGTALAAVGRPRTRIAAASLLALGTVVVPAAWIARNAAVTGVPTISTIEGTNLLEYRGAAIIARRDSVPIEEGRRRALAMFHRVTVVSHDPAERSRQESSYGLELIRTYPLLYAETMLDGAQRFVISPGYPYLLESIGRDGFRPAGILDRTIVVYSWGFLALTYLLAAIGFVRLVRRGPRSRWIPPVVLLGYLVVLTAGGDTVSRFRAPVMPTIAALASVGAALLLARIRQRSLASAPGAAETAGG